MKNFYYEGQRFKNGNLNIRFSPDEIRDINAGIYSDIELLSRKLYSFYYYHVIIKPGYYEGFTIDIENNFPVCFDGWEDKKEAQKEITELKQFLIDCAGLGLVKCSPGWCTGYSDYNSTIVAIKEAVKAMREEVKQPPTDRQYKEG